jgi:hypothetical protein
VLVSARCAVGPAAGAELDLAFVEVLLELGPLAGGRVAVFLRRALVATAVEELLASALRSVARVARVACRWGSRKDRRASVLATVRLVPVEFLTEQHGHRLQ